MYIVNIKNTKTDKERELKGDIVLGFCGKVDHVFGASCEGFGGVGSVDNKIALKLLREHYRKMKKLLKEGH